MKEKEKVTHSLVHFGMGQCLQEKPAVLLVFENRLPTISPVHDVIDRHGYCP
jgi:hypothetical protein